MNTPRYSSLVERLDHLKQSLLPDEFDDLVDYDDKTIDMAKGYFLLCHSEVEHYIEEICQEFVGYHVERYSDERTPSLCIISLLMYSKLNGLTSNKDVDRILAEDNCMSDSDVTLVRRAFERYKDVVKKNNGIKEKDIRSLISPTGLLNVIDPVDFTIFEDVGSKRGDYAHQSHNRLQSSIDPKDLYTKVNIKLLPIIDKLDKALLASEPAFSLE